jgi:uncharacterized protein
MEFLVFVLVGFAAQMIDGALGMAYGISSTTFLLSTGVPPAMASASVHTAEIFTTLVSGLSHLRLGNVDRGLVLRLLLPGMIGGMMGAILLSNFSWPGLKPLVAVYLVIMGVRVLVKAIGTHLPRPAITGPRLTALAFMGGLLDAMGGGGWGPIVTSTLVAGGEKARTTIGSVNMAEFFVTVAQVTTFTLFLRLENWQMILGLILGGVIAAPFAAFMTKRVNTRVLMAGVGTLIILLSLRTLWVALIGG